MAHSRWLKRRRSVLKRRTWHIYYPNPPPHCLSTRRYLRTSANSPHGKNAMERTYDHASGAHEGQQTTQKSQRVPPDSGDTGRPEDTSHTQKGLTLEDLAASHRGMAEQLGQCLEGIVNTMQGFQEQLARLASATDDLKAADQIIAELSSRLRELSERFYEREVLLPVIYGLIRLADGCRQQIEKFKKVHTDPTTPSGNKALRFIVEARTADVVQVEQMLADLGVESYTYSSYDFEPSLQKCVRRIETQDRSRDNRVAYHLLPGYKRHGNVIRKEHVDVHVFNATSTIANGGISK